MNRENIERFFYWINERHNIYVKRRASTPAPWTEDEILRKYKFTNPFRENDRVTVWMRKNWTMPKENEPFGLQIFNICLFRMFGTPEFAESVGWQYEWKPEVLKRIARNRLFYKEKTFTGAYIITNQGISAPKEEIVVDHFLAPVWENQEKLAEVAAQHRLEAMHKELGKLRGWGGGGFMAYEAVTDMNYTPVLAEAVDKNTWANAGPGAKRGLNRIHDRDLKCGRADWNKEMKQLLEHKEYFVRRDLNISHIIDMRCIEHSLCEWDKYERVRLGQGRPRSVVRYKEGETYPVEVHDIWRAK